MRNLRLIVFVLLSFFVLRPEAFSAKNEVLTADDAKNLLKELNPNIKILYVQQSPVSGLWEIGVDTSGRKAVIYVDHAKKHLISGNIVNIKNKSNLTQESFQKINKVDVSLIPLKDAVVMGEKTAKNRVIVFDDPD